MTNRLRPIDGTPRDPRGWMLIVGLAALLLLAAVLPFAVGGSDDGPPVLNAAAQAQDAPADDADDATETEPEPEAPPETDPTAAVVTYDVFLDRDPFEPVREPEVETDADGEQAPIVTGPDDPNDPATPGDGGNGSVDDPATPPGSSPPGSSPPGDSPPGSDGHPPLPDKGCAGDEEVVCDGRVVSLVEIGTEEGQAVADVQVDTTVYRVRAGDTFADQFRVLSISGDCATFLYGDERFRQCEGESTLK